MLKNKLTWIILLSSICIFTFVNAQSNKQKNNRPLMNTHWELVNAEPGVGDRKPFIYFENEGKFHGYAGCNQFFGQYFHTKKKMDMDYTGATKRFCHNMEVEDQFLAHFRENINRYKIEGDTLYLMEKKEIILKFVAVSQDDAPGI